MESYDGVSKSGLVIIPIKYLENPVSTFFNVVLSASSLSYIQTDNAAIGSPSATTVTILGFIPPPPPPVLQYSISANASPNSKGRVYGAGIYNQGAVVELRAIPNKRRKFLYWTENGRVISRSRAYRFYSYSSRYLIAKFR